MNTARIDDCPRAVLAIHVWGAGHLLIEMQRQSLKARILDHAETRLLEQGFRGMRVDELARDVGISKRTLYEQFRTKEEMAREALIRLTGTLQEAVDEILLQQQDEAAKLRAIVMRLCQTFERARPPFYRDLETTPVLTDLVDAARARCFAQVEDVLRSGMANGCFRSGLDPRLVRRTLLGAVEAIIRPTILTEDRLSLDQAFDGIFDVILNGVFGRQPSSA